MGIILIYITNPTKKEARETAKRLLEKKLIACANVFSADSLYRWRGKIAEENEFIILAKTTESNFEKVKTEVENTHSYAVPCVIKIKIGANKKYGDWLKGEVKS